MTNAQPTVGDQLNNGAVVLAVFSDRDGHLVLAKRRDNFQPWVTWRVDYQGEACWGRYFDTLKFHLACKDFQQRIADSPSMPIEAI